MLYVPSATALSLRPMWRSFEVSIINFPSPKVYGETPIVVTKKRNYTVHDVEDLLTDISLTSMMAFDEEMRRQTGLNGQFKSIKLDKAGHGSILTDEGALNRVMQEILEANRISS